MRIGPRYDKICANINKCDGRQITWSKELRYLGIFLLFLQGSLDVRSSLDYAKRSIEQRIRFSVKLDG